MPIVAGKTLAIPKQRLIVSLLFGGFTTAYFLFLASDGLKAYFTGDDVMNFYHAWVISVPELLKRVVLYYSTDSRPLPGLTYRVIYFFTGFHPLPFRILCFALILMNLFLLYRFTIRLTGSIEIAWLATLLASYHAWFIDIYLNTSTLEELACFSFYFSAFLFYLRIRQRGRYPTVAELAVLGILFVCALDSKPTAVTLPLVIALYEFIFSRPRGLNWLWNEGRAAAFLGIVMLPYVLASLLAPDRLLANHPLYHLVISPARYLHTFHLYLNVLFYQDHFFADAKTIQLWIAMGAIAWFWRKRYPHLLFCCGFILLTVLPFIFISHYSGFFMYLPSVGWAIYIATLLDAVATVVRRFVPAAIVNAVVFLAVAAVLFPFHVAERAKTTKIYMTAQAPIREFVGNLDRLHSAVPVGGRALFLNDPFQADDYTLLFTMALYYRDPNLMVDRAKSRSIDTTPANLAAYDDVFDYRDGRLIEMKP